MFDRFRERLTQTHEAAEAQQTAKAEISAPKPAVPVEAASLRRRTAALHKAAHLKLLDTLNLSALTQASKAEILPVIAGVVDELLPEQSFALNKAEREQVIDEIYHEVMGLGPLDQLLSDENVSDILINGPDKIFVEQNGLLELTNTNFHNEAHLRRILQKIVTMIGRRLDESTPYVDARLPDGSRLNAVISPIALDGTLVSIRKFRKEKLSLDSLMNFGAMSPNMAAYLRAAVASRLNIVISGGTGSGKTTLMNAISASIGARERIITVEDVAELQLQQSHVGRMEARQANIEGKGAVTQRDCIRNALRMRPDRIIVGETRGDEVLDMLQAMNTGHDGSMTTIHANSARDACNRIENLIAMSGIHMPLEAMRKQIASAVNVVVQVNRLQDGSRKLTSITEITGCENGLISMQEIFYFNHSGITPEGKVEGEFMASGIRSHYSDRFQRWGLRPAADLYDSKGHK